MYGVTKWHTQDLIIKTYTKYAYPFCIVLFVHARVFRHVSCCYTCVCICYYVSKYFPKYFVSRCLKQGYSVRRIQSMLILEKREIPVLRRALLAVAPPPTTFSRKWFSDALFSVVIYFDSQKIKKIKMSEYEMIRSPSTDKGIVVS